MICANDMAARRYADEQGELRQQADWEHQQMDDMGASRHPSLMIALEDAHAAAAEDGSDALLQLFYEQWIAGNPLAHAAVPESDICDALRPYWEAMRNDEY